MRTRSSGSWRDRGARHPSDPTNFADVYFGPTNHRLRISLDDVEPQIWRTLVVASDTPLADLARILVATMGWEGYHPSFIWSVADLLRGDYKQSEYGKVVLPLTVLRRFDCVLAPVKQDMLDTYDKLKGKVENFGPVLDQLTAVDGLWNTSRFDIPKRLGHEHGLAPLKYFAGPITVGIVITPAKWYVEHGVPAVRGVARADRHGRGRVPE